MQIGEKKEAALISEIGVSYLRVSWNDNEAGLAFYCGLSHYSR